MRASEATSEITVGFVKQRAVELERRWSTRNTRMDDYEKLFKLDVWSGTPAAGERRVTSPRAFTVVEATRALLFTRRPVLEVPSSAVQSVAQKSASDIEKHLYGSWDRMRLMHVIDDCEFNATCLGQGFIRVVYDPETPVGDFPLIAQSLDPRNVFHEPDPRRPLEDMEVAHYFDRTRRQIMAMWGELEGTPDDATAREAWLDEEVEYIDYWCCRVVEEDEPVEDEEEEELGVVARTLKKLNITLPEPEEPETEEREGDSKRQTRLHRRILNAVVAGGQFVKEPVIVPGYERLPFFRWSGTRTPLADEDGCMSVLYPISGGERKGGSQGLIAVENELIGMKLRLVEQRAAAAFITNDDSLSQLDSTPGAVNIASKPDFRADFVVPPGDTPETDSFMGQIGSLAEDATIPGSMLGRYQAAASGVAVSLVTNPVLMRIAARQRDREEVLQEVNKSILSLTEEYAPDEGWAVWGRDAAGKEVEARLAPADIAGYRRNRVHLSARLPKDTPSEALMLRSLIDSKLLSRRSGIERLLQMLDLAGQSPEDEIKQVLVESILFGDDDTRKAMAQRALAEYDEDLAAAAAAASQEVRQVMAPMGPPPGPRQGPGLGPQMAQGPMMGMPPPTLPPQRVPEAVGLEGMQGMGMPPFGPPIPGGEGP